MSQSRIPSPARSQGAVTPRRHKPKGTRSVGSPARSTASGSLTALIQFKENNRDSFALSPAPSRRSVLNDDTYIDEPRRQSWWKKLGDNTYTREVMEVLNDNKILGTDKAVEEYFNIEVLSQEKKNYTVDLPDSSDSESISSIVIPQRKLFTQKDFLARNKFGKIIGTQETLAKLHKSNVADQSVNVAPKSLFSQKNRTRTKPVFPAALLNISPNKTANKTKEMAAAEVRGEVRNIFGNRAGTKRKNMFANFIMSESEDEIPDIQPKVFGFQNEVDNRRDTSISRGRRERSPTSSITTDVDMEEWQQLPSSTMVDNQLEIMMASETPIKRARLSNLADIKVVNIGTEAEKEKESEEEQELKYDDDGQSDKNSEKNYREIECQDNVIETCEKQAQNDNKTSKIHFAEARQEECQNENMMEPQNNTKESQDMQQICNEQVDTDDKMKTDEDNSEKSTKGYTSSTNNSQHVKDQNHEKALDKDMMKVIENEKLMRPENNELVKSRDRYSQNDMESDNENGIEDNYDNRKSVDTSDLNKIQLAEDENEAGALDENITEAEESVEKPQAHSEDDDKEQVDNEEQDDEGKDLEEDVQEENDEDQPESKVEEQNQSLVEAQNASGLEANSENDSEAEAQNNDEIETREEEVEKSQIQDKIIENEKDEDIEREEEEEIIEKEEVHRNEDENIEIDEEQQIIENEEHRIEIDDDENNESEEEKIIENEEEHTNEVDDENENIESEEEEHTNEVDDEDENVESEEEEIIENEEELTNEVDDEEENIESEEEEIINEEDNVTHVESEAEAAYESDRGCSESEDEQDSHAENQDESEDEIQDSNDHDAQHPDNGPETPNISHDPTGRNEKENDTHINSPEAILHDKTNQIDSFMPQGRNTSIRKTTIPNNLNIRPSFAPPRESTGISDGTRNSSAEGSGWDSHRTTRKTLRQTLGKDFTPRKSLRALVMEKSAKRQNALNDVASVTSKFPQANSTELPETSIVPDEEEIAEENHDVSKRTRQTTLEMYLQKIKKQNYENKLKMEEAVRNSLKAPTRGSPFKVPSKPMFPLRKTISKPAQKKPQKQVKTLIPLDDLPDEVIEDMKYKPPKRFRPSNAAWITKRLYKFLESKLESKYDYKARVRAEKLVESIYHFSKDLRRRDVAPHDAVDVLKHEMARLDVVKTHFDFYQFFHDYMPREIRIKVVPDVVNKIGMPRHGVFSDILQGNAVQG